jgi:V-type H+-transporting ATPase subunit d
MMFFNVDNGFLEGVVRGLRGGLLLSSDYSNLSQCDNLDDVKMHLQGTKYGQFLANEPPPIATTTIQQKATEKMVEEFKAMRAHANQPLAQFLDYITYGYMIDNVITVINGTLHDQPKEEVIEKCHPLGVFGELGALSVFHDPQELYDHILVDTPLAPYFISCVDLQDLTEYNIEIIRNRVFKAYLEDFFGYCQKIGGTTAEVMGQILSFEADRRAINITLNSFGVAGLSGPNKADRRKLYPKFGTLYPAGTSRLCDADDVDAVKTIVNDYEVFKKIFAEKGEHVGDKSFEDVFFEHEIELHKDAFERQFHYGVFYSLLKLKEQEIRNIVWISECIKQDQKARINEYVPLFR